MIFTTSFLTMLAALSKIFLIIILGGILVRKKIITHDHITGASNIIVAILLPCLTFSKIIKGFNPAEMPFWWAIPIGGVFITAVSMSVSYLLFRKNILEKKDFVVIGSIQNFSYLVLPIGQAVYSEHFDEFALYVFMLSLAMNPFLWSFGKIIITQGNDDIDWNWKRFVTPPFVANVIAVLFVLIGVHSYIPEMVLEPIDFLGDGAIPLSTLILGATLGSISFKHFPRFIDVAKTMSVKFIVAPVATISLLLVTGLGASYPLLADFFVIESAAAPATGIILMVKKYGGDSQRVGSTMLVGYIIGLLALPFWIAIWKLL